MDFFILFGHVVNQTLLFVLKNFSSYEPRWQKWKMAGCQFTSLPCSQVGHMTQAPWLTHIHPALMHTGGREQGLQGSCSGGGRIHGLVQPSAGRGWVAGNTRVWGWQWDLGG